MRTIPPYIHGTISSAERKLFKIIKESENLNNWYCLHSLGLSKHLSKREGEIDILLVGPSGIFVIEVKGGRVSRENGVWKFTDRYGRVSEKRESPFTQARSAMYSLRADLSQQFGGSMNQYLFGYGVALPDIEFTTQSPEWDLGTVFDVRDNDKPFFEYLERLSESWKKRQRYAKQLTKKEINETVRYLRGDFETVRPVSVDISETEEEIIILTEEQLTCLDAMSDNQRVIFVGAAGTGKTLLAAERARRNEANSTRTLFLCFNKLLAAYLEESLNAEGRLQYVTVKTAHSFFYETIVNNGLEDELKARRQNTKEDRLYSQVYPELFRKAWNKTGEYQELIIDEAQDVLSDNYIKTLDLVVAGGFKSGNWTIFLDPENQKNMFLKLDENTLKFLRESSVTYRLSVNCRNTKPIAIQTEIVSGIETASVKKLEGLPVRYIWYEDAGDQAVKISEFVNKLLREGVEAKDITILSPKRYSSSIAGTGRLRLKIPLYNLDAENVTNERGDRIAYASVQSYKGLEGALIVLTDIEELDDEWYRVVNYVGFTRARTALVVAMKVGLKDVYMSKLKLLSESK